MKPDLAIDPRFLQTATAFGEPVPVRLKTFPVFFAADLQRPVRHPKGVFSFAETIEELGHGHQRPRMLPADFPERILAGLDSGTGGLRRKITTQVG